MSPTFDQCFAFGHSPQATGFTHAVIRSHLPSVTSISRSTWEEDRLGVDWWVTLQDGRQFAVDQKSLRYGPGWLPLEIWSHVEEKKVGWTLRENYLTDLVCWVWVQQKRFVILPFKPLRAAFRANGRRWHGTLEYPVRRQFTPAGNGRLAYHSEIVLAPASVVMCEVAKFANAA